MWGVDFTDSCTRPWLPGMVACERTARDPGFLVGLRERTCMSRLALHERVTLQDMREDLLRRICRVSNPEGGQVLLF